MDKPWIIQSKLVPPAPPAGWLARTLLPVGQALPPAVLVLAGPGYGKTLGLLALATAGEPDSVVAWLGLDDHDGDPASFFHYLVAALRRHVPPFGAELDVLLARGVDDVRLLWRRFFEALASYNLPRVCVAIDDVHHLFETCPEIVRELVTFFDKLPPGVHVLLASRKRLPQPLARLRARGALVVLDQADMAFTPDEQAHYLRARAADRAVPAAWSQRAASMEGWPLGIALVAAGAVTDPVEQGDWLAYVAEELFQAQPPQRQAFMLRTSILQEVDLDACIALETEPDLHLAALEADMLLQRTGRGYRYPSHLQAFLAAQVHHAVPTEERKRWHGQAAEHFQVIGRPELALPHWVAAEAWPSVSALCDLVFPPMRYDGRLASVGRWLASFPPDVVAASPGLQVWLGHDYYKRGIAPDALAAYERARRQFAAADDAAGELKVLVRLASLAVVDQDLKRANQLLLMAQARAEEGLDEDRVDLCLARALAAEHRGDMALMRECNEAVLDLPIGRNVEIAASHCIAHMNLYTAALHRGELEHAARHAERAVEIATVWKFHPYLLFGRFLQVNLHILNGELEPAGEFIRQLPPTWTDALNWHNAACAYAVIGHYHQSVGSWPEAEDALRRSRSIFEKAGFREGCKVSVERSLWLLVQRRQYARAEGLAAELEELDARSIYDLALVLPRARARHLRGDSAGALALLEMCLPEFERLEARLYLARGRYYEAAVQLALGEQEAASSALAAARALAEAHGYGFLREQDPVLWEELKPLIQVTLRVTTGRPQQPIKPLEEQADLADVPRLNVRCFGALEVRRSGILLDQWARRKARVILAGLALYPAGLRLEELGALMGIGDMTSADINTLQHDVSALRRILEPGLKKGDASLYVRLQGDRYALAEPLVEAIDVAMFTREAIAGDLVRETDPVAACMDYEAALAQYRGNLFEEPYMADFFEGERLQHQQRALGLLIWLAGFHEARGDHSQAETALRRAVALAPVDEPIHLALMRHLVGRTRGDLARLVYWDCRKTLKSKLGLAPGPELEAAYRALPSVV